MTRDELMDLAERILTEEDDEVLSDLMEQFDRNVTHPEGSSLFFYPEGWNARNGGLACYGADCGRSGRYLFGLPSDLPVNSTAHAEKTAVSSAQNLPKQPPLATMCGLNSPPARIAAGRIPNHLNFQPDIETV